MASVRKRTWNTKTGTRVSWLVDYRDAAGKRRFQQYDTRKEAQAQLAKLTVEVANGVHTPMSASITVAEAAEIWLQRGELEGLERATLVNYRRWATKTISPALGREKLARLTVPAIEAFRDTLVRNHGRKQVAKILVAFKGVLQEAMRRGLVAQNVAQPVKVSMRSREQRRLEIGVDIPSKEDIRRILEAAQGRWRPLLVTAALTGLRASELRGLTWDAVDFESRALHLRRRMDFWGTAGAPKSAAGRRSVPMSPMVANTLREWKLACPKGEANLVFPNTLGRVETLSNMRIRGLLPVLQKLAMFNADGSVKFHFHSFRHFAASHWIDMGFQPKKVQTMMGHANISVTFDRYGHLFPSLEDDHAKLAAGELALVGGAT
jgi:integrase